MYINTIEGQKPQPGGRRYGTRLFGGRHEACGMLRAASSSSFMVFASTEIMSLIRDGKRGGRVEMNTSVVDRFLYSAILRSRADSLRSHLHE